MSDLYSQPKTTSVRSKTQVFEAAGEERNTKTFILCDQQEAKLAAYMGYEDVADLRAFCISHYNLEFWLQLGMWSKQLRVNIALELIRDAPDRFSADQTPAERYPLKELDKYSAESNDARNHRLAHLLVQMVTKITNLFSTLEPDMSEQTRLGTQFEGIRPDCKVPSLVGVTIRTPKLVTQHHETSLECYNRAFNLLKYFSHCTTPTVWQRRFSTPNWNTSVQINPTSIPFWMRSQDSFPTAPPNPAAQALAELPAQTIKVTWKRRGKDEDAVALEAYIEEADLTLPNATQLVEGDPRVLDLYQFRDSIRRQYNCGALGLQLKKITILFIPTDESKELEEYNLFDCDWNIIQHKLKSTSPEHTTIEVEIRLRKLDQENQEELFESKEPPPALKSLFVVVDDAILPKSTDDDAGDPEEHSHFFKTVHPGQKPGAYVLDPKKRFPDHDSFLDHFDGHNVEEPQQLRTWQEKVLQSIQGTIPHAQEPVKKTRIAGQTLDQEQQGILMAAQEQGEYAAMVKTVSFIIILKSTFR